MYARLVRFEGSDPEVLERELEEMRRQIRSGMSDESMADMNEQTGGQLDKAQLETLRRTIKRTLVLADRAKGSSAMIVFCDTEEDIRTIDEMFNQMSPPDEGGGKRQSVDIYEVAIDEQTG
jgi:hypothetical protein